MGSDPRPDRITLLGGLRHSLPLRETHLSGMAGGLSFGCTPPAPPPPPPPLDLRQEKQRIFNISEIIIQNVKTRSKPKPKITRCLIVYSFAHHDRFFNFALMIKFVPI